MGVSGQALEKVEAWWSASGLGPCPQNLVEKNRYGCGIISVKAKWLKIPITFNSSILP